MESGFYNTREFIWTYSHVFQVINSLATFQAMMNEILRDLINTGKIVSFINDIMVETVSEKEHDELVEEILKRMKENNLYVNLEKYR